MTKTLRCALFGSAAIFMGATAASATSLDFTGLTYGYGESVTYNINGSSKGGSAGQMVFEVDGGPDSILAWCLDAATSLHTGAVEYTADSGLFGATIINNLDKLFTQHFDKVVDKVSSAGFQIAIWEIISDSDTALDVTTGDFELTNSSAGALAAANEYLTLGSEMGGYAMTFFDVTDDYYKSQDLVTVSPVPLPAAAWMLGAGVAGLAGFGRKRRKAA